MRSLHQNGDPGIRRRGRLSARRSRRISYNTRKGRDASGAGSHRRGTPVNSVRVFPCHFTDGSAAACDSGNTCAPIEKRSGVSCPGKLPWTKHLAPTSAQSNGSPKKLPGAVTHRSLPVLYRELYGVLRGYRQAIALALLGLSLATLLKLIPPAATKAAIDYVLLARPLPAAVQAWSPVPIPESPKLRLVILVGVVTVISVAGQVGRALEPLASDADDQARAGRRAPQGLRARHAAPLAPGLPAQVGRRLEPLARGCRRRGRADLQHALQPLARGGAVPGRAGRPGLGRLATAPGGALAWCRAFTIPTCSGTAASGRSFATSARSARRSTARRPRSSAACAWSGPSAGRRASRRGSWARTTSWPGSSSTSGGFRG